jgi:hypothetical protein
MLQRRPWHAQLSGLMHSKRHSERSATLCVRLAWWCSTLRAGQHVHSGAHAHACVVYALRTRYRLELRLKRSLKRTTVLEPLLLCSGSPMDGPAPAWAFPPRRRWPRCHPIAIPRVDAGQGCSVCKWMENSNLTALTRFLNFCTRPGDDMPHPDVPEGLAAAPYWCGSAGT